MSKNWRRGKGHIGMVRLIEPRETPPPDVDRPIFELRIKGFRPMRKRRARG